MKKILLLVLLLSRLFSEMYDLDNRWYDYKAQISSNYYRLNIHHKDTDFDDLKGMMYLLNNSNIVFLKGTVKNNFVQLSDTEGTIRLSGAIDTNYYTIVGTITLNGKKQDCSFNLIRHFNAPFEDRYIETGFNHEIIKNLHDFAFGLKKAILSNDKYFVSKNIKFPITVEINNKKITITNQNEFIKYFDSIFYPEFMDLIKYFPTKYFSCNYEDISFGDRGEIYFKRIDGNFYIAYINNSKSDLKIFSIPENYGY